MLLTSPEVENTNMITRRRYQGDSAAFEEIVKNQMDRSSDEAHGGFRRFVLTSVQREFAAYQDQGELVRYLKQIPIIQSIQRNVVNDLVDAVSTKRLLQNLEVNPEQTRSDGQMQMYLTENMEVVMTTDRLPVMRSITISEDRIKMYEELLKTGVTVDQLLMMFYASAYLSLPTPTNIRSWMELTEKIDVNVLKDPLTQLGELHEAGVDFAIEIGRNERDAEITLISDIAGLTLHLIEES